MLPFSARPRVFVYNEARKIVKLCAGTKFSLDPLFACFLSDELIDFNPDPLENFIKSVNFTHSATGRCIGYFGDKAYSYGDFYHPPVPFTNNSYIAELKRVIECRFPSIPINSALVNYYPKPQSLINLHSDDEREILPDSYIITVSFGCSRSLLFTTRDRVSRHLFNVELAHRSVLVFSRNSQTYFKHGVLAENAGISSNYGGRISVTFRLLK